MNTFPTLLKREFWEHKGGMFWAPVVVGGMMLAAAGASVGIGLLAKDGNMRINGEALVVDGQLMTAQTQQEIASTLAKAVVPSMAPLAAVLAFVLLFYALGSLYDDRRDRSVLFWKSMPVSDSATVMSKLVSMALVAPLLTALIGSTVGMLVTLMAATGMSLFGSNILAQMLLTADFWLAPLALVAVVPVYALWLIPSLAWCMAISAWARRVPFLWAVGIPVVSGVLLSWQQAMFDRNLGASWFWEEVVGRLFGNFIPGMWFAFGGGWDRIEQLESEHTSVFALVAHSYATLASPALWIGLAIGSGLLVLAIRLRRWREDA